MVGTGEVKAEAWKEVCEGKSDRTRRPSRWWRWRVHALQYLQRSILSAFAHTSVAFASVHVEYLCHVLRKA